MVKNKKKIQKHPFNKPHITRFVGILSFVLLCLFALYVKQVVLKTQAVAPLSWPMFDYDSQKSGMNPSETAITSSTVTNLKKLWQVSIPNADGSPVYLAGVTTAQGTVNLVFVTTQGGSLLAFNDANGQQVWRADTTGSGSNITSSPVLDPSSQYIYSYGLDGKVHKYNVSNGSEVTADGWPLIATLIPNVEKGSSALTIANGYLYVTTSGYPGDAGPYAGHIVGENLTTGVVSVFNSLCANIKQLLNATCGSAQSGVWARPGAVVDPVTGNVFITTGNGPYAPPNNLGDSMIELSPDLSTVIDTYTPATFQALDSEDADLGSTDPAMVPTQTNGTPTNILVQGGKDNIIRVLNRQNLSGQAAPYHTGGELQTLNVSCQILPQPISYTDPTGVTWVFATDMCDNLYAYKVVNSRLQQVYVKSNVGHSSPIIVNGMLFIQSAGSVKAVDSATGNILWTGQVGSMHWQSPIVVNGQVFVLSSGTLTDFGLSTTNSSGTIESSPTPSTGPTSTPIPTPTLTPIPTIPVTPTLYIIQLGPTNTP